MALSRLKHGFESRRGRHTKGEVLPLQNSRQIQILRRATKSRLGMARTPYDPPNGLVLDDPSNHLDLATKEMLVSHARG